MRLAFCNVFHAVHAQRHKIETDIVVTLTVFHDRSEIKRLEYIETDEETRKKYVGGESN